MASENETQVSLFVKFCSGIKQQPPLTKKSLSKKQPSRDSRDWPVLRFAWSLEHRILCVHHCLEEVIRQEETAAKEIHEIRKTGRGTYRPILILVYHFESFMDQIYRAMENVAKVNLSLYQTKSSPPAGFHDQKKNIIKGILSFSNSYDRIMKEDMEWYEDMLRCRHNSTHFAIGTGVYKRDDEGEPVLQYLNYEHSWRDGMRTDAGKIHSDVLTSAEELRKKFDASMETIGAAWMEKIDPNVRCTIPIFLQDKTEFHELSLKEYLAGEPGNVVAMAPLKNV